jgi:hypothetical protein
MTNLGEACLHLSGWGTARADLKAIAGMRKSLPAWVPKDTPGHFLKHADEQTVLAVAALDDAIQSSGRSASEFRQWAIVAAPRFIGRIAGGATLYRYSAGGSPTVSPHLISQHSLHSMSGALSILLSTRQPNFGVGGTGRSLVEGLLTALTFSGPDAKGTWLAATGWDPEPQLDDAGNCLNAPVCHAVALALRPAERIESLGRLQIVADRRPIESSHMFRWNEDAAGVCRRLTALAPAGQAMCFAWQLGSGGVLTLEATKAAANLRAAA